MRNMSKFGKVSMKATALALAFIMSLPSASYAENYDDYGYSYGQYEDGPVVNNAQSVIDEAIERNVPNAFIKHVFAADETLGEVKVDLADGEKDPQLKLTKTLNSVGKEGLLLEKVDTGILARTKIYLGKYNFSDYKVDRVIYNMLAKKNLKGNAQLFLDNDSEPFVEFKIKRTADENWEATKALTADVKEANLSDEHDIYFSFVADNAIGEDGKIISKTGTKTNLYFESMFFMEGSTPVLNFELDNDFANMDAINNSPTHTVEGYGDMHVEIPDDYKSEYTTKKLKSETYELDYIRGRGNSTWLTSKKPYKIKLADKQNLFGMGKNKHWVLLANYYDYTLLRNRLTFDIAKKLGLAYTPDSVCVNVVIDGEYYGSYQLCEQIRVDEERVNINDLEEDIATSEPEITGGYLINMGGSWLKDEEEGELITSTPYNFVIESPEYKADYSSVAKKKQLEYINNYFAILNKLVFDLEPDEADYQDEVQPTYMPYVINNVDDDSEETEETELDIPEGATWRDYMDEKSLIDYYLIQEFSLNGDSYASGSTYLYKPRNDKVYWGPVWDFDFVAWNATDVSAKKEDVQGYAMAERAPWVAKLIECDAQFRENIVTRWGELKKILDEAVADGGTLDKMANETYMSALANYQVKRSLLMGDNDAEFAGRGDEYYYDANGDLYTLNYFNEIERLKNYIKDRAEWVDGTIDDIQNNMYSYYDQSVDVPVFADRENLDAFTESGDKNLVLGFAKGYYYYDFEEDVPTAYIDFETLPDAPAKEGMVFDGWYYLDKDGNECKLNEEDNICQVVDLEEGSYMYIPALFAKYSSVDELKDVLPNSISFVDDTLYMNIFKDEWYDSEFDDVEVEYSDNILDLNKLLIVSPVSADTSYIDFEVIPDSEYVEAKDGDLGFYVTRDNCLVVNDDNLTLTIVAKVGDKEIQAKLVVTSDSSKFAKVKGFTVEDNMELNVGDQGLITPKLETEGEGWIDARELTSLYYTAIDANVVEVGNNGVVFAKAAGEAVVLVGKYIDENLVWKAVKVKVNDPSKSDNKDDNKDEKKAPVKGTKFTDKNFTYKVTKAASDDGKTAGEVALVRLVNKNIKKANIKATLTVDGYKYKVTSVANKAFKGAKKLKNVTIGKNVNKIGAKAFFKLKKLTKVTIKSKKLPKIGNKAFVKKGKKITIKVNAKLKKKAKKALKKAKCKGVKVK